LIYSNFIFNFIAGIEKDDGWTESVDVQSLLKPTCGSKDPDAITGNSVLQFH
jgi:hypothetical protein